MRETKTLIVNIIGVMISCFYILALNIVIFWFLLYLFNNHFKGIEMIFFYFVNCYYIGSSNWYEQNIL